MKPSSLSFSLKETESRRSLGGGGRVWRGETKRSIEKNVIVYRHIFSLFFSSQDTEGR